MSTMWCALMFGYFWFILPAMVVVSLWAIYRVVLGGRLCFGEWVYKMINRRTK